LKKDKYRYTSFAAHRAKSLRHNMTPPERHLWYDYLRTCKWKFQRQKPIGPYIVDFICYEHRLILELDANLMLTMTPMTTTNAATATSENKASASCA